jgi:hypothetical protein
MRSNRSSVLGVLFLTALCVSVEPPLRAQQGAAPSPRRPVLVELFTSEGCSDCPPADALLARLDATQFVPDAQAIVLSEHVTYWDHQGWRDPFSLEELTARQEQYVRRFGLDSSYTPQMVVDGAAQFVGNDPRALSRALATAAAAPKKALTIENAHSANGVIQFSVHGPADSGARLVAVLAADATHSEVSQGENAGRTLHHVAVVRVIKEFDERALDGRPLEIVNPGQPPGQKSPGAFRLVVFLADHKTGKVEAAAEQTLPEQNTGAEQMKH